MDNETEYFDYLPKHERDLERYLGLRKDPDDVIKENLTTHIAISRRKHSSMVDYRDSGNKIRTLIERAIVHLLNKNGISTKGVGDNGKERDIALADNINRAKREGIIKAKQSDYYHECRKHTNPFEHASQALQEQDIVESLIYLDRLLRSHLINDLRKKEIAKGVSNAKRESMLATYDPEAEKKAAIADAISRTETKYQQRIEEQNKRARDLDRRFEELTQERDALVEEHEALGELSEEAEQNYLTSKQENESLRLKIEEAKQKLETTEQKLETIRQDRAEVIKQRDEVMREVDAVLNEHDFICKLLQNGGKATDEQRSVMFAIGRDEQELRNNNNRERHGIIKVRGGAGTGKTLCLLAAIMHRLETGGQMSFESLQAPRNALFLCFNKELAAYVRGLVAGFPEVADRIYVESYDAFLNQLVVCDVRQGYEYLEDYNKDNRFPYMSDLPHYWGLIYDDRESGPQYFKNSVRKPESWTIGEIVEEAMSEVAKKEPQLLASGSTIARLVDSSEARNVRWMTDEILWMDNRYSDVQDAFARYPQDTRAGRGGARRADKGSDARKVILEVWREFQNKLREHRTYTMGRVVARLLDPKSNDLPRYDVVAVDEAQDLSVSMVRLFRRFVKDDGYLFIAGDEGQRLYMRDFSWRDVDEGLGYTPRFRTLTKNMRNPPDIQRFVERLHDTELPDEELRYMGQPNKEKADLVWVSDQEMPGWIANIVDPNQSTVVITNNNHRLQMVNSLTSAGLEVRESVEGHMSGAIQNGLYVLSVLSGKGLEFDTVIVDYREQLYSQDPERELKTRNMQFTRARKRLFVLHHSELGEIPLLENYRDYFPEWQ